MREYILRSKSLNKYYKGFMMNPVFANEFIMECTLEQDEALTFNTRKAAQTEAYRLGGYVIDKQTNPSTASMFYHNVDLTVIEVGIF